MNLSCFKEGGFKAEQYEIICCRLDEQKDDYQVPHAEAEWSKVE